MATSKPLESTSFLQTENIAYITKISDSEILLRLQKGEFNPKETWFLKDENNQEYIVMPENILKNVISIIRNIHEEKLLLELARDISKNTPIDFDDVMAVAVNKIESKRLDDGSLPKINTKSIIKEIKKDYPNLFFDINQHFLQREAND